MIPRPTRPSKRRKANQKNNATAGEFQVVSAFNPEKSWSSAAADGRGIFTVVEFLYQLPNEFFTATEMERLVIG